MKRVFSIIWNVIQVFIIVYVLVITIFMFCSNKYGYTEIGNTVIDTSKNNLLIIKKNNNIKTNDKIYYYSIENEKYVIRTSKVKEITKSKDTNLYKIDDDIVISDKLIGKSFVKIPVLGKVVNCLESRMGFLLLVLLPILVVFVYQVYKFIISVHYIKVGK